MDSELKCAYSYETEKHYQSCVLRFIMWMIGFGKFSSGLWLALILSTDVDYITICRMIKEINASVKNQVLEKWLHVKTENANLCGFIVPVSLRKLKGNGIAKIVRKGKIKNKHDLTTVSS